MFLEITHRATYHEVRNVIRAATRQGYNVVYMMFTPCDFLMAVVAFALLPLVLLLNLLGGVRASIATLMGASSVVNCLTMLSMDFIPLPIALGCLLFMGLVPLPIALGILLFVGLVGKFSERDNLLFVGFTILLTVFYRLFYMILIVTLVIRLSIFLYSWGKFLVSASLFGVITFLAMIMEWGSSIIANLPKLSSKRMVSATFVTVARWYTNIHGKDSLSLSSPVLVQQHRTHHFWCSHYSTNALVAQV